MRDNTDQLPNMDLMAAFHSLCAMRDLLSIVYVNTDVISREEFNALDDTIYKYKTTLVDQMTSEEYDLATQLVNLLNRESFKTTSTEEEPLEVPEIEEPK